MASLLFRDLLLASGLLPAVALALVAQTPTSPARILQRTGAAPDGFSNAVTIQELPDGRAVVGDAKDRRLFLVDFGRNTSTQLGRQGSGPNEYASIGSLSRLAGDTVVMVDFVGRRLVMISPQGTLAGTRPLDLTGSLPLPGETPPADAATIVGGPRYMDALGGLYFTISYFDGEARSVRPVAVIARFDPKSATSRRAAPVQMWYPDLSARWRAPFLSQDVWAVAMDGRIARVVPRDYHVEWYRNDSLMSRGPSVAVAPVRVTEADRQAYRTERAEAGAAGARMSGPPGANRPSSTPPPSSTPGLTDADFPRVKPPFLEGFVGDAAQVTPEGELWVTRAGALGDTVTRVDVFDGAGRRTREIVLPSGRRVLGFGRGVVFLIRTDEDGQQWLERYRR